MSRAITQTTMRAVPTGFVTHALDEAIDRRSGSTADVFQHHRVPIVPVTDRDRVVGVVVTRPACFRALAERVLDRAADA